MAHIGSVFLGDVQRQRILSTSTPPSSPPPNVSPTAYSTFPDSILEDAPSLSGPISTAKSTALKVTPEVALELRTRLLETLVAGVQRDPRTFARADGKHQIEDAVGIYDSVPSFANNAKDRFVDF